jgi:hypothetical protein
MDVTLEQIVASETNTIVDLSNSFALPFHRVEIEPDLQSVQIASNPNTNPRILRELATDPNWQLRQLVANNPNTPTDLLWQLGIDFPEAVLTNPIFALLQLEHLQLAAEIPTSTLTILLQCPQVPIAFMEYAVNQQDYSLWLAVAYNINTPSKLLANLAHKSRHQDRELIRAVAAHPNTPPHLFEEIIAIGCSVAQIVAQNPQTPLPILEKLLHLYRSNPDLQPIFIALVALHPRLTPALLMQMALAPSEAVAEALWLAKQSDTPSARLAAMVDLDWDVLGLAIARHPNTPVVIVEQIWQRMQAARSIQRQHDSSTETFRERLIYDSFVCHPDISIEMRGELRKLLSW